MLDLFYFEKPKPTIKLKVSYHRFFEGDVVVVWVNRKAADNQHIRTTIAFLEKHFKKHKIVVMSVSADNKPIFLSKTNLANKFIKYNIQDFQWSEAKIILDESVKNFKVAP